ncbi:hypothetical protein C0J52_05927 [Blattella germanica]|nr:hypothetical protein C0J52_05927 [Blattella germanica]
MMNSSGVQLFAFHGNINEPLKDEEPGKWNRDITKPRAGRWVFEEPDVQLKVGDVIYYWIFVQVDGLALEYRTEERIGTAGQARGHSGYEVPDAKLEKLHPKGLRVSIPDEPGVELFAFHGKVNSPLNYDLEAGTMSRDITRPKNGRWIFEDKNIRLKNGDIIYYWLYTIVDGL